MILKYFLLLQEGGLNTSGETEADIPKFITDSNDKTSYVRGKFLGKVSGEHYISTCSCKEIYESTIFLYEIP